MENLYESPLVRVVECRVEKGFAVSSDDIGIGGTGAPD